MNSRKKIISLLIAFIMLFSNTSILFKSIAIANGDEQQEPQEPQEQTTVRAVFTSDQNGELSLSEDGKTLYYAMDDTTFNFNLKQENDDLVFTVKQEGNETDGYYNSYVVEGITSRENVYVASPNFDANRLVIRRNGNPIGISNEAEGGFFKSETLETLDSTAVDYGFMIEANAGGGTQTNVTVEISSDNDGKTSLSNDGKTLSYTCERDNKTYTFNLMQEDQILTLTKQTTQDDQGGFHDKYVATEISSNDNVYIACPDIDFNYLGIKFNGHFIGMWPNDAETYWATDVLNLLSNDNVYQFRIETKPEGYQEDNVVVGGDPHTNISVTFTTDNDEFTSLSEDGKTIQYTCRTNHKVYSINLRNNDTILSLEKRTEKDDQNNDFDIYVATIDGSISNESLYITSPEYDLSSISVRLDGMHNGIGMWRNDEKELDISQPFYNISNIDEYNFRIESIEGNPGGGDHHGGENENWAEEYYFVDFGEATWTIKGRIVSAEIENLNIANGPVAIRGDQIIKITGYDPKVMEIALYPIRDEEDDYFDRLKVNEHDETWIINRDGNNFPNDLAYEFKIQRRTGSDDRDDYQEKPKANLNAVVNLSSDNEYANSYENAIIEINGYPINEEVEFGQAIPATNNAHYYSDEHDETVDLYFTTFFNEKYVGNITVNNIEYPVVNYMDYTDRTQFLNHYGHQMVTFIIPVPKADHYDINVNVTELEGEYQYIGNFLWSDREEYADPEAQGHDMYIGHSLFEITKVEYWFDAPTAEEAEQILNDIPTEVDPSDEQTVYIFGENKKMKIDPQNGEWVFTVEGDALFDDPYIEYDPYRDIGSLTLPAFSTVTAKITPDYGYQVLTFSENENPIIAEESISEFTFPIHKGNFHLAAEVVPVENVVEATSTKVNSGSIDIAEGGMFAGSVVLSVNDIELDESKIEGFEGKATEVNAQINTYLDIDLDQVFYKGTAEDVWTQRIHELSNDAIITLKLEDDVDIENLVIVHNINDGDTYEIIPIDGYNPVTRTITFRTKSFSNFAIATMTPQSNVTVEITTDNDHNVSLSEDGKTLTYIIDENEYTFSLKQDETVIALTKEVREYPEGGAYDVYYASNINTNTNLYLESVNIDSNRLGIRFNGEYLDLFNSNTAYTTDLLYNISNLNNYQFRIEEKPVQPEITRKTSLVKVSAGDGTYEILTFNPETHQEEMIQEEYNASEFGFSINNSELWSSEDKKPGLTYDSEGDKVEFRFEIMWHCKFYEDIVINGVSYNVSDYLDFADRTAWIIANHGTQTVSFIIPDVAKANSYDIVVKCGRNNGDVYFANFLWTADPAQEFRIAYAEDGAPLIDEYGNFVYELDEHGERIPGDDYIGHSRLEFVKAIYAIELPDEFDEKDLPENGVIIDNPQTGKKDAEFTVTKEMLEQDMNLDNNRYRAESPDGLLSYGVEANVDFDDGSLTLPGNALITMRVVPDYGYQVTSVNGGVDFFTTEDGVSEFTIFVPDGTNGYFHAVVEEVENEVIPTSNSVEAGEIVLGDDAAEDIQNGTVRLSVEDIELSPDKIQGFEDALSEEEEEYTISNYLDINLNKVLYRGTADDVWSEQIHTLSNKATITLQLEDGVDVSKIVIVHNVNNGDTFEIIPIKSYDPETNTITFETDSFSNFAIATKTTSDEPEYTLGDVNNDGEIDAEDATLILRFYAGNIQLTDTQLDAADVDGSGEVDAEDATLVLRYYAGNIANF